MFTSRLWNRFAFCKCTYKNTLSSKHSLSVQNEIFLNDDNGTAYISTLLRYYLAIFSYEIFKCYLNNFILYSTPEWVSTQMVTDILLQFSHFRNKNGGGGGREILLIDISPRYIFPPVIFTKRNSCWIVKSLGNLYWANPTFSYCWKFFTSSYSSRGRRRRQSPC